MAHGGHVHTECNCFTLDECRRIAALHIPAEDLTLHRDQDPSCMLFLSGMRIKNVKHATTYLFNIPELLAIVTRWVAFVRERLTETATWYAHVKWVGYDQYLNDHRHAPSRAGDVNRRLRLLLDKANVLRRSAHQNSTRPCGIWPARARSLADNRAISQNLMHENIQITDGIYANLVSNEVRARVIGLGMPLAEGLSASAADPELACALAVLAKRLTR